jgi:enolase
MAKITLIRAREVLDSRGNPTVEVSVYTRKEHASAMVPSGASTGRNEAFELRDHDARFGGKGVLNAVHHVNELIAPRLKGMDCRKQEQIDTLMREMDGTSNKAKLGANAILGVSMAVARVAAHSKGQSLHRYLAGLCNTKEPVMPVPCMNILNGGVHAGNPLDVQEFMILPIHAQSFSEALRMCAETYQTLKLIVKHVYGSSAQNVGDEGGFAPPVKRTEDALKLVTGAIRETGYEGKIMLGMDIAASELYKDGAYKLDGRKWETDKLLYHYEDLCQRFPVVSIEDPFDQEDFTSFGKLTQSMGDKVQVVGDDLLTTNPVRLQKAIERKACNALLLKMNQVGTLSESIQCAKLAQAHDLGVMVSHRSGETEDPFIADLAVGLAAGQIKTGAPCRGERTAKYNQLLRIEEELGGKARYAGRMFRNPKHLRLGMLHQEAILTRP